MATTLTFLISLTEGSTVTSASESISVEGVQKVVSASIPGETTDQQVVFSADVTQLEFLLISSTQAVTIETNDGTTPDDTLSIAAGKPLWWRKSAGIDCPLGTDVTTLYVTNAGATAATLTILAGYDATV